jgi:hypothetical protein
VAVSRIVLLASVSCVLASCKPNARGGLYGLREEGEQPAVDENVRAEFRTKVTEEANEIAQRMKRCPILSNDSGGAVSLSRLRGARWAIKAGNRQLGSINMPLGNAVNSEKSSYHVGIMELEMSGDSAPTSVASYARFAKFRTAGESAITYETPPLVEIHDCGANLEEIKSTKVPSTPASFVVRFNTINAVLRIEVRIRLRTLGEALKPVCRDSIVHQLRHGNACDELTIARLVPLPPQMHQSIVPTPVPAGAHAFAVVSTLRKTVDSYLIVSTNEMTLVPPRRVSEATTAADTQNSVAAPSRGHSEGPTSRDGPPLELWLPYFIAMERHVEKLNSALDDGANTVAGEIISFLPGGPLVHKPLEFAAGLAIDKLLSKEEPAE